MFSELACDFEVDFCFWQTQTQSWAHPWLPFSGPTPTAFTGPDAAFDGNWYVYAETDLLGSDSSIQPEFILTSHIFTASSAARYLHFSYHMSGYDIQTLWLASWSLEDGNGWLQTQLWSRQGPQGSSWGIALVSVPPNAIVLEFVTDMRYLSLGQYGIWRSDIALDAIGTGVPTVDFNQLSCNFEFDVCLWLSTGNSTWQRVKSDGADWWLEAANTSETQHFILETLAAFNITEEKALIFDYQLFGSSSVSLKVEQRTTGTEWQSLFTESGGRDDATWRPALLRVPAGTVALRVSAVLAAGDVVRLQSLQAVDVVPSFAQVACSFEADLCGWSMAGGPPWLRDSRSLWPLTGPQQAADGQWYIYAPTWQRNLNTDFVLASPVFGPAATASRELHFSYNMYGEGVGSLRLESWAAGNWTPLWTLRGDQGIQWGLSLVSLPSDSEALRFVAALGNSFYGDIALDAVGVGLPSVSIQQLSCRFLVDKCLWNDVGETPFHLVIPRDAVGYLQARTNSSVSEEHFVLQSSWINSQTEAVFRMHYWLSGSSRAAVAVEWTSAAPAVGWQNLYLDSGDTGNLWHQAIFIIPASAVALRVSANATVADIVAVNSLRAVEPLSNWSEMACSFEVDFCSWSNSGWLHWRRASGPTPTMSTGPETAYQGNWYIYTESDNQPFQDFILEAFFQPLPAPEARYLHFSYHMHGYDIHALRLESWEDGWTQLWSRQWPQGSSWGIALVSVPANAIALRFVGSTGRHPDGQWNGLWTGDIALDAIGTGVPTVDFNQLSCNFEFDVCLWLSTGNSTWQRVKSDGADWWLEAANTSETQHFILETLAAFNITEEKALIFDYQLFGSSSVSLKVEQRTTGTEWQSLFTESGGRDDATWRPALLRVPAGTVALRVSAVLAAGDVVRLQSLQAVDVVPSFASIWCTFQSDLCGWSSSGSPPWLRDSSSFWINNGIGPSQGAFGQWYIHAPALLITAENGIDRYLYRTREDFVLLSPVFGSSSVARYLSFVFAMYHENDGSLRLESWSQNVWTELWASGQGVTSWALRIVKLPPEAEALRFVGVTGFDETSDVALGLISTLIPTASLDLACDFEYDGQCLWVDTGVTATWRRTQGHSQSACQVTAGSAKQGNWWLEVSGNGSQAPYILETAPFSTGMLTELRALEFEYQLVGSLASLEVEKKTVAGWQSLFLETGGGDVTWRTGYVHVPAGATSIRFVARTTALQDVKLDQIALVNATSSVARLEDISCDFEDPLFCGWSGDSAWRHQSGPTADRVLFNSTGPEKAFREDFYVYTQLLALGNVFFESPSFPRLASECYLEFAYHMLGSGIGDLKLQYLAGGTWWTLWSRTGSQGSDWFQAKVTLPIATEMLRFMTSNTVNTDSNIAVDALVAWQPEFSSRFLSLASGGYHTCALHRASGEVKCWGNGHSGALGYGRNESVGTDPEQMGARLPPVDLGQGARVTQIACGFHHTCAVLEGNGLKCWGYNVDGQLGQGHTRDIGVSPNDMGENLPVVNLGSDAEIKQVVGGVSHTCVLLDGGIVKCFGKAAGYGDGIPGRPFACFVFSLIGLWRTLFTKGFKDPT